jgi:hypothetical protein
MALPIKFVGHCSETFCLSGHRRIPLSLCPSVFKILHPFDFRDSLNAMATVCALAFFAPNFRLVRAYCGPPCSSSILWLIVF